MEPHNPNYSLKIGQIKMALASIEKDANKKKQMITEAREGFQKSIEKKSDLAEAHFQLSLANNALGNTDQAIDNGKKAVVLSQRNANYIINLARMMQVGASDEDMKNAEQLYRAVIAQNDSDINSHFYLGLLYEKAKNKQGAKDE